MRLLTVASSPSDYVEMSDLARMLAKRGHPTTLLYLYAESDPSSASAVQTLRENFDRPDDLLACKAVEMDALIQDAVMAPDESSPAKLKREARRTALREAALAKEREKREKEEESERARERKGQKRAKPPAPRREKRFSAQKALRTLRAWANHHNIRLPPEYKRIRQWVYATARGIDYARSPTSLLRDLLQWKRDVQKLFDHPELPKMVVLRRPSIVPQARLMSRIYRGFLEMFRETIREGSFDAVLIPEDVVGYVWPVAVKAAHDAQIPALVFPYTLANRNEPLQSLRNEPGFQTKNNEAAARLYPAWRAKENGADLIRLPSPHVFAHEWLHIAPPDPWMMNSGYADAICVDSPSSFAYFAAGGIPPDRMEVVGSVSQDVMFELRRDKAMHLSELRHELGLEGDKPLLLLSGCPNQLVGQVPGCEFADFDAIATFVGESLAPLAADYHLVVRPHPNFPDFGPMLDRFGFKTATTPTSRLVPLASLFVAFASATIRWSIACAVPTVNYDVFHYGYLDFGDAAGVVSMSEKDRFLETVRALGPGTERYAELATRIEADSKRWSMMDGLCAARIETAIGQAYARRHHDQSSLAQLA